MQEKESVMVVRSELKIPLLGITVRHHSASLVIPNSYPCDGIFNPHLAIIKDSYIIHHQFSFRRFHLCLVNNFVSPHDISNNLSRGSAYIR